MWIQKIAYVSGIGKSSSQMLRPLQPGVPIRHRPKHKCGQLAILRRNPADRLSGKHRCGKPPRFVKVIRASAGEGEVQPTKVVLANDLFPGMDCHLQPQYTFAECY